MIRGKYYILIGRQPVPVDLNTWVRQLAYDKIGDVEISTAFLVIDHGSGNEPPLLFETMVFGGALNLEQARCTTWDEAEAMHKTMCERVRNEGTNA